MKITSVDIIAIKPTEGNMIKPVVCRINTDEGIYGLGEVATAIMTGAKASFEYIKELAGFIIGLNPLHHEVIWEKLYRGTMWPQGNGGVVMSAISAIDTALWDIKGKYYNCPVYELLGGKQRESLRCYASHYEYGWNVPVFKAQPFARTEEYRDACLKIVDEGYTAVKANFLLSDESGKRRHPLEFAGALSPETLRTAEKRAIASREAIGPDVDLIIENNSITDSATAIQYGKRLEPLDILFYEECASPLNANMFKKVSEHVNIPLAMGEKNYLRYGFLPFFQNHSVTVAQPDIGACGGITEAKKIADMAYCYDVGIQAHVCCGPISIAAGLHLEAAIPNFYIHETHVSHTGDEISRMGIYDYRPEKGYIKVPELPGLGQDLSDYALKDAYIESVTESWFSVFQKK